jgi:uncharacterized protein (DUF1015 family)
MELNGSNSLTQIRPFRGTYYNPLVVDDLSKIAAPPYDIIDERRKQQLLSRSPYNIVRMELPQSESVREFWNKSATLFRAWKKGEILVVDSDPALYVYRQTFDLPGSGKTSRTGILSALKCKEFSSGEVLPHEKTFPVIRAERLNLLRACQANFSQVFMSFRDPDEEVLPFIEEATAGPVFMGYADEEGVSHELWRVVDTAALEGIVGLMGDRNLIIADGHHRYETALFYANEDPTIAGIDHPRSYVSAALFRSEDPGLVALPVHRMLRHMPLPIDEAYKRIGHYFDVQIIQQDIQARQGMFQERLDRTRQPSMVMITAQGAAMLTLRKGVKPTRVIEGPGSDRWKSLDISILHSMVLSEGLGLDVERIAEEGDLYFTPWESTALNAVVEGEAKAAFLVKPTQIDKIWEIAEGGERMPHKSTYFYPKLSSGMIIYDHQTAF